MESTLRLTKIALRLLALTVLVPAALVVLSELATSSPRRSPFRTLSEQPAEYIATVLALNLAVVGTVWCGSLTATRRWSVALVPTGLVVGALELGHALKLQHRGQPLYPTDIETLPAFLPMVPSYLGSVASLGVVLGGVVATVAVVAAGLRWTRPLVGREWFAVGCLALLCLGITQFVIFGMGANQHVVRGEGRPAQVANMQWNPLLSYETNLFPLSFALNAGLGRPLPPRGYPGELDRVRDELQAMVASTPPSPTVAAERPDIVVVLSESFFDLSRLGFELPPHTVGHFRALAERSGRSLFVPAVGGGTANVEFELLTGFRMAQLPTGAIPYQQHLRNPVPTALPAVLRAQGYRTVALHPNSGSFWNRTEALPLLGFDTFIDLTGFEGAPSRGGFVSDRALVDRIAHELDVAKGTPTFVFAISMQNHGAYEDRARYPVRASSAQPTASSSRSEVVLANYAEGLHDADLSLRRLMELTCQRARPTLVLFFGDHLSLPEAVLMERGLGTSQDAKTERARILRLSESEVVAVANHEFPWSREPLEVNQLGAEVLRAARLPMPRFWRFIEAASHEVPVQLSTVVRSSTGEILEPNALVAPHYERTMGFALQDVIYGDQRLVPSLLETDGAGTDSPRPAQQASCPVPTSRDGNLLASRKASASATFETLTVDRLVDGDLELGWGAGGFPPQWVEFELESPRRVAVFRALVTQHPPGETRHVLSLQHASTGQWEKVHTFAGVTSEFQWLEVRPEPAWEDVAALRLTTEASPSWVAWREIEAFSGP